MEAYKLFSSRIERCLKANSPFLENWKLKLSEAIAVVFDSRVAPFDPSDYRTLVEKFQKSYDERLSKRAEAFESARKNGLSWYTAEQEADELSLELLQIAKKFRLQPMVPFLRSWITKKTPILTELPMINVENYLPQSGKLTLRPSGFFTEILMIPTIHFATGFGMSIKKFQSMAIRALMPTRLTFIGTLLGLAQGSTVRSWAFVALRGQRPKDSWPVPLEMCQGLELEEIKIGQLPFNARDQWRAAFQIASFKNAAVT